jgi:hypothetical protein
MATATEVAAGDETVTSFREILGRRVKVTINSKRAGQPIVGVDLRFARIADEEVKQLLELKSLQALDLSNNQFLTDAGLSELKEFRDLRTLNLDYTRITDKGLKELKGIVN